MAVGTTIFEMTLLRRDAFSAPVTVLYALVSRIRRIAHELGRCRQSVHSLQLDSANSKSVWPAQVLSTCRLRTYVTVKLK